MTEVLAAVETPPESKPEAALWWAARGRRVLPVRWVLRGPDGQLRCSCSEGADCDSTGKHPLTEHGVSEATTDEATIRRWWMKWPMANVGVALDNEVVVDLDPRHSPLATAHEMVAALADQGRFLARAPWHRTGGQGLHVPYRAPEGMPAERFNQQKVDGLAVQLKAGPGAYIVVPPSVTEGPYEVIGGTWDELTEAPGWLVAFAKPSPNGHRSEGGGNRLNLRELFEGVPEGKRSDEFWRYASSLRGRNIHIEEGKALVRVAWAEADQGDHPFDLDTALDMVDRAYAQYEPNEPKAKVLNLRLGKKKLAKLNKQVQAGGDLMGLLESMADSGSQASMLVDLAEELYDFHQSLEGKPFVVPKAGPNIARMLRGSRSSLRAELAATFNERYEGGVPNSEAMSAAMRVIEGRCLKTEPVELHLRLARVRDGIVIDLGDEGGRAVVVKPGEWRHLSRPPVIFKRTRLTAPLPLPQPGGDLEELRGLLNVSDRAWPLLVAYLVATLIPDLPHPVLLLRGEQGTGKTTAARLLSRTVDPATAQTRTAPRDTRSWVISVAGSWTVVLDNLSGIQDWLSDAICRAVTGDGWVDRELYTDEELTVISNRRVVVLNSIDPGALRGDLGDRLVPIELRRIEEADRRLDREIEERFREVHPRVFGAMLDLLARVLEELPEIELDGMPRMADFARVVAAVDEVRETNALEVYLGIRDEIAQEVVGGDPVALAVQKFMAERGEWQGTASELLAELDTWPKPDGWPRGPQPLSAALRRAAPGLRQADEERRVDVEWFTGHGKTRMVSLRNPKRAPEMPEADQ